MKQWILVSFGQGSRLIRTDVGSISALTEPEVSY